MLTPRLDDGTDYVPAPVGGLEWINNAPLGQPQTQLYGGNDGVGGGSDLRASLLQRLRQSFGGDTYGP